VAPDNRSGKTVHPASGPRMMRPDASNGAVGEARETVDPGGYGDDKF
jgi:hypothetical protein